MKKSGQPTGEKAPTSITIDSEVLSFSTPVKEQRHKKPFVITELHRDIAAVILAHKGKPVDDVFIFQELFHSNEHSGWELEMHQIMKGCHELVKHGFLDRRCGEMMANSQTGGLI